MRKIMMALVILLSAILILSPAFAASKGKGKVQKNAEEKSHWKSGESPAPLGWDITQGTRTRKGWGEGSTPTGITKRGSNPAGFSKGGKVK